MSSLQSIVNSLVYNYISKTDEAVAEVFKEKTEAVALPSQFPELEHIISEVWQGETQRPLISDSDSCSECDEEPAPIGDSPPPAEETKRPENRILLETPQAEAEPSPANRIPLEPPQAEAEPSPSNSGKAAKPADNKYESDDSSDDESQNDKPEMIPTAEPQTESSSKEGVLSLLETPQAEAEPSPADAGKAERDESEKIPTAEPQTESSTPGTSKKHLEISTADEKAKIINIPLESTKLVSISFSTDTNISGAPAVLRVELSGEWQGCEDDKLRVKKPPMKRKSKAKYEGKFFKQLKIEPFCERKRRFPDESRES